MNPYSNVSPTYGNTRIFYSVADVISCIGFDKFVCLLQPQPDIDESSADGTIYGNRNVAQKSGKTIVIVSR